MASAWHVHFEPTIVHLTPKGGGQFDSVEATPGQKVNPPPGSFPVVTSVRINLTDDAQGSPPLKPGDPSKKATLEFIGRAKPATPSGATPFVSMGIVKGQAVYDSSGSKPVPQFICGSKKVDPSKPLTTIDFTEATTSEVARSDWVVQIERHPDTFDTGVVSSFFVKLPWQFVENPGRMQLSARLTVDGTVAADETRNTPLDIPLKHNSVPEDADPKKSLLTFFGVRNLYTRANANTPSVRVPFNPPGGSAGKLRVISHATFTEFCAQSTGATIAEVFVKVKEILSDAGFGSVETSSGQSADDECAKHWKSVDGHFMAINIKDPDQSKPDKDKLENKFAAAIEANNIGSVQIPAGMEERIPFFDFYVFAESANPPTPTELARSESLISVAGSTGGVIAAQGLKALTTPIVIARGVGSSSTALRQMLSQIDKADHANLLATTICHEIGHTFGLRHSVAFVNTPPYKTGDAEFSRGVMGIASLATGLGTPRMPLSFFGPVQLLEIKRLYL